MRMKTGLVTGTYVECLEDECLRPSYIEGRCKAHHDREVYRRESQR